MKSTQSKGKWLIVLSSGSIVLAIAAVVNLHHSQPSSPLFPTNIVLQASQIHWQHPAAEPVLFQLEGVESAERINEQLMRRTREQWQRSHRVQAAPPTLPGGIEEGK